MSAPTPPTPNAVVPLGQEGLHYNRITKEWEKEGQHEVDSRQDGSTFPEEIGDPIQKVSFVDQVKGEAKKFAGIVFGKEYEVAQGEAFLEGKGVAGAIKAGNEERAEEAADAKAKADALK